MAIWVKFVDARRRGDGGREGMGDRGEGKGVTKREWEGEEGRDMGLGGGGGDG